MTEPRTRHNGLALAAVFQCAALVDDLAYQRPVTEADIEAVLQGLFVFDPPSAQAVYPAAHLHFGKAAARECLENSRRLHLIGYVGSMVALQGKLAQRQADSEALRQALETVESRLQDIPLTHFDTLEALARLYTRFISPISPRIMVQGKPQALRDARTVATIRSLLLAGVRAARLWVQTGGSRWQLIFQRRKLLQRL